MSLCLFAVAAWCAVHAGPRRDETGWMAATAAALVLANATKYASALFDPVVVAIDPERVVSACQPKQAAVPGGGTRPPT